MLLFQFVMLNFTLTFGSITALRPAYFQYPRHTEMLNFSIPAYFSGVMDAGFPANGNTGQLWYVKLLQYSKQPMLTSKHGFYSFVAPDVNACKLFPVIVLFGTFFQTYKKT